ncbi:cyclic GMP-AMP synthase-like receptor isoform X1 [Rhipicephalus microplus]|uniref:Putative mab-21-like cell fate specification ovary overexpressed n=2 Tax=Rhipicephalus microplus TaxID=6941 RepID=A0A6M2CR83_RHIMP
MDKKREQCIDRIHEALSEDTSITKRNQRILREVLDCLCVQMKSDLLFARIFNRLTYTGSSFEGLRIRQADEFDINLVMKLPIQEGEFKIVAERPGHVSYMLTMACKERLKKTMDGREMHCLFKLFTTDLKFMPTWWREWFQSVVDKALKNFTPPCAEDGSQRFTVHQRASGPARTLFVYLPDHSRINIDLVPVLEYIFKQLPAEVPRHGWFNELLRKGEKRWLMVPKPPKDDDHLWRIHFPYAERKLMKDLECIKPTIRLIKALRDKHKWALASYSVKTVVMRHRLEHRSTVYWQNKNRWTVLNDVLKRLHDVVHPSGPGIRSLYDENVSLIPDMSKDTRNNIAQRLQKILNVLARDSDRVCEFFLETTDSASVASNVEENLCDQLVISSASTTEVCETPSSPGIGSVVDGMIGERPCRPLLGSTVNALACGNAIVVRQKVVCSDLEHENGCNDAQVTLCILADGDHLLAETSCSLCGCQDQRIEVSKDMLDGLTVPSFLVLKQSFKLTGKVAPPQSVQTRLTVMKEGKPLVKTCFYLQLQRCVEECQVRVPFPRAEPHAKL